MFEPCTNLKTKFLVSRGRDAEAIDVLHKIAKFNKQPMPTLTIEQFEEIDKVHGGGFVSASEAAKNVVGNLMACLRNFKGLFSSFLQIFIFVILAIAYMVSTNSSSGSEVLCGIVATVTDR